MDYEENLKFTSIPPPTDHNWQIATLPYILQGYDWQRLPGQWPYRYWVISERIEKTPFGGYSMSASGKK